MKRRDFIVLLGVGASLRPHALHAGEMRVIGYLNAASPKSFGVYFDDFRRGLRDAGFVEGRNVAIELRWADGEYSRLPALAAELVEHKVDVIVAAGGALTAAAAKAATRTTPIVFLVGPDPVAAGLVESMSHPGGNATGVALLTAAAWTKRLELASAIADKNGSIGVLLNSGYKGTDPTTDEMQQAARVIGRQLVLASAGNVVEIEEGLEELSRARVGAVLVSTDPFLLSERERLAGLALNLRLPTVCGWVEETRAGALMSYGSDQREIYYQVGIYTGRVLKGEKPADLPVLQATRLLLVINLKTAKTLDLAIPPSILARADEVIE